MKQARKLTKGETAFVKAVRDRNGGMFHRSVVVRVEALGLVRWTGGWRLVGCNSFSADRFEIVESTERAA